MKGKGVSIYLFMNCNYVTITAGTYKNTVS